MKLYVPNPQLWVDFFDGKLKGQSNQRGGARKPRIITVKPPKQPEEQRLTIKAVLPSEQATAQAKSELMREDINPKDVEKAFQTQPGRRRKRASNSKPSSSKAKRPKSRSSKQKQHRDIFGKA